MTATSSRNDFAARSRSPRGRTAVTRNFAFATSTSSFDARTRASQAQSFAVASLPGAGAGSRPWTSWPWSLRTSSTNPVQAPRSDSSSRLRRYGFFWSQGAAGAVGGYPLVLDARINRTRFEDFQAYLSDSGYVDGQTRRVALELALFNEESAHLVLARVVGTRRDEGGGNAHVKL